MKDVLRESRAIVISGREELFPNYTRLCDRATGLIETLARVEASMPAGTNGSETDWKNIAELAEALIEVVTAQDQWLADHDAALAQDVNRMRREIRNLNGSDPMTGSEG